MAIETRCRRCLHWEAEHHRDGCRTVEVGGRRCPCAEFVAQSEPRFTLAEVEEAFRAWMEAGSRDERVWWDEFRERLLKGGGAHG